MALSSNNRIAKNTLALYCRMILTMGVSLYTSRVVINALGVTDYGIYNVVGGIIAMLGFFNTSIGTSTQRFLNVGMVKTTNLSSIFSTAVNVHIIIGIITVLLLESVGIWFIYNKLVFPDNQLNTVILVYQCSVLSFFISIISAPYNAAIISYEKMTAFATLSILEVVLKLCIAFCITYYGDNKLALYSILLLCSAFIMRIIYSQYCIRKFKAIRYRFVWDWGLIKEMLSFSGWMIFGCLADLLSTQGVNLLINMFFGPVFNAARAIAVQVQAAVAQFSTNFIISVNPQIIKSYSAEDFNRAYKLVFSSSKISFFLMLILVIPISLRTSDILHYWLNLVPTDTSIFINFILIEYLIRSSYSPIAQINQASGNIRIYQLSIAALFLINFILSYFLFKVGLPVYSTFIVSIAIAMIGLFFRLLILYHLHQFPIIRYVKEVSTRLLLVAIASYLSCFYISRYIQHNIMGLVTTMIVCFIICIFYSWILGLDKFEKNFMISKLQSLIKKSSITT